VKLPQDFRILVIAARVVGHRALEALLDHQANVVGVLTLDECKAELTTAFTDFSDLGKQYDVNLRYYTQLNQADIFQWAEALRPDLGIVVGVSQMVGSELLSIPRLGFIGLHPTLLPQGRGRAPIPWALIKGLQHTGVSWFYCDQNADTGDLLAQEEIPVYYEDVSATLGMRSDDVAIRLLLEQIPRLAEGSALRIVQDESRATVWERRRPEDGLINWEKGRRELYDWVRGLTHPYPGAFTFSAGRMLYVWEARESFDERTGHPGEVLAQLPQGVLVATGSGNLLLTKLQWDGGPIEQGGQMDFQPGRVLGDR